MLEQHSNSSAQDKHGGHWLACVHYTVRSQLVRGTLCVRTQR